MKIKNQKILLAGLVTIFATFFLLGKMGIACAEIGEPAIVFDPKFPAPETQVKAKVISYAFDVERSNFIWRVNGKTVAAGVGAKEVVLTSPSLGKTMSVTVDVVTASGEMFSKAVTMQGSEVDLLWEALTYTPAWYKGKSMPIFKSQLKFSAIPFLFSKGEKISPDALVYEWSLNGKKDIAKSGLGKKYFIFPVNRVGDGIIVIAKISNLDKSVNHEKIFVFSDAEQGPKINLYADDLAEGLQTNRLIKNSLDLKKGDVRLRAEPFFFSGAPQNTIAYEWFLNGKQMASSGFSNIAALRVGTGNGTATLEASVKNTLSITQFARETLRIVFGE